MNSQYELTPPRLSLLAPAEVVNLYGEAIPLLVRRQSDLQADQGRVTVHMPVIASSRGEGPVLSAASPTRGAEGGATGAASS